MKKSILLLGICSVLLLGACSETPMADVEQKEVVTNDTASIQVIIDEAQAKFAQAQQQQHAWSSTADLLRSATAALANGDLENARKDSHRALLTANASLAQAKKQQSAWRNNIPG